MSAQAGSASLAAATAASSSAAVDKGRTADCSPVAGLKIGACRLLAERASSPPIAFDRVCIPVGLPSVPFADGTFIPFFCRTEYPIRLLQRLQDALECVDQLIDL